MATISLMMSVQRDGIGLTWWEMTGHRRSSGAPEDNRWTLAVPLSAQSLMIHIQVTYTLQRKHMHISLVNNASCP